MDILKKINRVLNLNEGEVEREIKRRDIMIRYLLKKKALGPGEWEVGTYEEFQEMPVDELEITYETYGGDASKL